MASSMLRAFARRVFPRRLHPYAVATRRLMLVSGGRVMQGPFRGLKIVVDPVTVDWPKVLGTYERELHPVLEAVVADAPSAVVNIGAAEGYYAVGLAVRCPLARSIAFETRPGMRTHVEAVALQNGAADRVEVKGWCGPTELAQALADHPRALVVVDIEGGEVELLDPAVIPGLAGCRLLVEEHDAIRPGCSRTLIDRFTPTHVVRVIPEEVRRDADLPVRWPLLGRWLRRMMREGRPGPQSWLYMVPAGHPL